MAAPSARDTGLWFCLAVAMGGDLATARGRMSWTRTEVASRPGSSPGGPTKAHRAEGGPFGQASDIQAQVRACVPRLHLSRHSLLGQTRI